MNDDWKPRPPVFPGEWLDEETSAKARREWIDNTEARTDGYVRKWLAEPEVKKAIRDSHDSLKREEIMQALADDAQKLDMGYDLRRHTVQPGDNANRLAGVKMVKDLDELRKTEQARQTAELALSDMRRRYWDKRGVNWAEELNAGDDDE